MRKYNIKHKIQCPFHKNEGKYFLGKCPECIKENTNLDFLKDIHLWDNMSLCLDLCENLIDEYECRKYPNTTPLWFGRKKKCKYYMKLPPLTEEQLDYNKYLLDCEDNRPY
jgi:hypothetical protein